MISTHGRVQLVAVGLWLWRTEGAEFRDIQGGVWRIETRISTPDSGIVTVLLLKLLSAYTQIIPKILTIARFTALVMLLLER